METSTPSTPPFSKAARIAWLPTAPHLKIVTLSPRGDTLHTVDSMPIAQVNSSRSSSSSRFSSSSMSRPSVSPRSVMTWALRVGLTCPNLLALGAAMGTGSHDLSRERAIS